MGKAKGMLRFSAVLPAALLALAPLAAFAGTARQLEYDHQNYDYSVSTPLSYTTSGNLEALPVVSDYVYIGESHKTTGEYNHYTLVVEIQGLPHIREDIYEETVGGTDIRCAIEAGYMSGLGMLNAGARYADRDIRDWEDLKNYFATEQVNYTFEEGSFMGRPALIDRDTYRHSIVVHLNEVELPVGVATLFIQILVEPVQDNLLYTPNEFLSTNEGALYFNNLQPIMEAKKAEVEALYSSARVSCYFEGESLTGNHAGQAAGGGHVEVDTQADAAPGQDAFLAVPAAIVLGVAGLAAAGVAVAAGVAAASASGGARRAEPQNQQEQRPGQFFLEVYKNHGDTVKAGAAPFQVNARMVEQPPGGPPRGRPDLTAQIRIFARNACVQVGPAAPAGGWMAAMVQGVAVAPPGPKSCAVHFLFTGAGGSFQNNMQFRYVGESGIDFPRGTSLFVLAGSGRAFALPCLPQNFCAPPSINVNVMGPGDGFALEPRPQPDGGLLLTATAGAAVPAMHGLSRSSACEVVAQNAPQGEYARGLFEVVLCREGLAADFMGKPREVSGKKNQAGNMPHTRIRMRLGVWNEATGQLDYVQPTHFEASYTEDSGRFEALGVRAAANAAASAGGVYVDVSADTPLPATGPVQGRFWASCVYSGRQFEFEEQLPLTPDMQQYTNDLAEEYRRCVYIIETYVPETWRRRKLAQLERERARKGFGLADYKLFRKNVWQYAQNAILLEKKSYLDEAAAADEAIFYLEIAVWVGDVAFDIAVGAAGGPIAGFLLAQAKSAFIDLVNLYREKGMSLNMLWAFITGRITQTLGAADGLVEMPKPEEKKKLAVWLTGFFLYRFGWHFIYTADEYGNPAGFSGALQEAAKDIAGKAVGLLLAEYVNKAAEKSPVVQAMKNLKAADDQYAAPATSLGGQALDKTCDGLARFAGVLNDYVRSITG